MSIIDAIRSQGINFSAFRPFFPFPRTLLDIARMPFEYASAGVARPFPLVVDLCATNRCNLRCGFCYNRDNLTTRQDELGLEAYEALFDEAAPWRAGIFLSGGEPLLRRDLSHILAAAKARGLPVGLVTNGTAEEPNDAGSGAGVGAGAREPSAQGRDGAGIGALVDGGLDVAVVSVHGVAEYHDRVVGRRGAFAKAMGSLELLSARMGRPRPLVNIVLHPEALPGLDALLAELAKLRVRPRLAHLSFLTRAEQTRHEEQWAERLGGGDPAPPLLNYLVDEEELERIIATLPELRRHTRRRLWSEPVLAEDELARWYAPEFGLRRRCLFVWQSTVINADGTVYPCQYYAYPMGNIRDEALAKIWNNERYRAFRRALKQGLLPGCARCCKL